MQDLQSFFCNKIPYCNLISNLYWLKIVVYLVTIAIIAGFSILTYYGVKLFILNIIRNMLKQRRSIFLQVIAKNKTLITLAHIIGSFVFWLGVKNINQAQDFYLEFFHIIHYIALTYLLLSLSLLVSRLIWSLNEYYEKSFAFAGQYPIYSYLRVAILFFWIIVGMMIIATLADTSPLTLFTSIGAVSAIFLLVFRDTLLGIVSSIQVAASGIVRIGDRVSLDKYGIDGNIINIAITTVKVQNADNTIATIPTYALTSEVVKNWRGMEESGGRRIKRAINIDINSIVVCDVDLINRLSQGNKAIANYVIKNPGKDIINLALYREYILNYLNCNPAINREFVIMVRHLDPGINGLPLEIYAFTKDTSSIGYEAAQADIFEHCFAALSRFNLKITQYTSN